MSGITPAHQIIVLNDRCLANFKTKNYDRTLFLFTKREKLSIVYQIFVATVSFNWKDNAEFNQNYTVPRTLVHVLLISYIISAISVNFLLCTNVLVKLNWDLITGRYLIGIRWIKESVFVVTLISYTVFVFVFFLTELQTNFRYKQLLDYRWNSS